MLKYLPFALLAVACGGRTDTTITEDSEDNYCMNYSSLSDVLDELEGSAGQPVRGEPQTGNSTTLESDGQLTTAARPKNEFPALLEFRGAPQAYVVSMRGKIAETVAGAPGLETFPLAFFRVQWNIGGATFETQVDGNSDQFLVVYAKQIQVYAAWDFENADITPLAVNTRFPVKMGMSASICPAMGAETLAKRTRFLNGTVGTASDVAIPYAARDFIIRSTDPDFFGAVQQHATASGLAVDNYLAADVLAAHAAGSYLPVASVADFLRVFKVGGAITQLGFIEFRLEP